MNRHHATPEEDAIIYAMKPNERANVPLPIAIGSSTGPLWMAPRYAIVLIIIPLLLWVGLSLPPRTVLLETPLAAGMLLLPFHWPILTADNIVLALITIPMCVLLITLVVYLFSWLRHAQDPPDQQLATHAAEVYAANSALWYELVERKQAETQFQRQIERLVDLRAIDSPLTANPQLHAILNAILEQITAQLHVDAADVLLFNAQTHILDYAAGHGFQTAPLSPCEHLNGTEHTGPVALDRRILTSPHLAEAARDRRAPLFAAEGFVAYYSVPLIAKEYVQGVLEIFHRTPLAPDPVWHDMLELLAGQAAAAIDNTMLFDELQHMNRELTMVYDTMIEAWSKVLNLRDRDTAGHSQRVTEMTLRLAKALGVSATELVHVRRGALLHDIGKIGIPDAILLKPGPLTDDEWAIMRKHPVYAYEMLAPIAYLRPALDFPYCHHEKWDGSGYPRGLKGESIPLAARIFAVVDVWDAMRSDRPYRRGWPEDQVVEHIRSLSGTHFDPHVVQAFLQLEH